MIVNFDTVNATAAFEEHTVRTWKLCNSIRTPLKSTLLLGIAFRLADCSSRSSAAEPQTSRSLAQSQARQSGQQDSAGTFKVNVNVVNLYFVTKDKHGTLVPNLAQDQFEVLENGQPQTIKYYKADATQPLTLGLLVDTSGSEARMLGVEQEVVGQFIGTVLREKDLAFLMSFDVNVDLLQDLTATSSGSADGTAQDRDQHRWRRRFARPGRRADSAGAPQGHAALRCHLPCLAGKAAARGRAQGADHLHRRRTTRAARPRLAQAIEAAQKADTIVYVLLVYDPRFIRGDREMRRLCEETGGRVIVVGTKPEKLKKALEEVSDELRSQYYIGYTPSEP